MNQSTSLMLATTYDANDPILLGGIISRVQAIETTPDTIAILENGYTKIHPTILKDLGKIQKDLKIIAHGVGLSIGSYDGMSESYLGLLDELADHISLMWHSEHLGYTQVDGENLNTMLTVPRTKEVLDMLISRINTIQNRYGIPFLLEHIIQLLPNYQPEYTEAEFLNILTQETGCGLILDVYNLECDALNFGFDIKGFLKELNFCAVKEMHIAGGVEHNGFQLDIHSQAVADSTIELAKSILGSDNQVEVLTYEILPQAVKLHGQQFVFDELDRLSDIFEIEK